MYRSEDRIWDMEVFPIRLGVEAEIFIPPEHDIRIRPDRHRSTPHPTVGDSVWLCQLLEREAEKDAGVEKA